MDNAFGMASGSRGKQNCRRVVERKLFKSKRRVGSIISLSKLQEILVHDAK